MPPVAAPQLPAQVNPALMQALRLRAQQGAGGVPGGPIPGAMPNSMNAPVPGAPSAPVAPVAPRAVNTPGGGTPAQQMMKTATTAQSPMQDPETRASAKDLIMKLMKHM